MTEVNLMFGDCLDNLKTLEDNSVDSIVTDPPYGLSFMGKKWDYEVPSVAIWEECLRVLKPGGHLLAFAGTRTQHRMAVNIEDAGFEIRDMIAWVYGSGFPKSHNISKALDKVGSPEAQQWDGWGTALKPALEPITVARKPISEKTVAGNVLKYGTGAINIDESRVGNEGGRFPANLIHDGSEEVLAGFPQAKSGGGNSGKEPRKKTANAYGDYGRKEFEPYKDNGSAARFFYCAKASKKDRDEGLDRMEEQRTGGMQATADGSMLTGSGNQRTTKRRNTHPTVKPTDLMKYLVRMVTPKGGVVLDPFMGSGSTGKAVMLEGFNFLGMELDEDYMEIAKARIEAVRSKDDTR